MSKKKQIKKVSGKEEIISNGEDIIKISHKERLKKIHESIDYNIVKNLIPVLLVLLVMFVAFQVRIGPVDLGTLDERVEASVLSNIRNIITQDVNSQYSNLNEVYRQEEIDKRYNQVLNSRVFEINDESINIDDLVNSNVEGTKQRFQSDNGQTYLNAIDPYHFLGLTTNYVKNGHTGTEIIDGQSIIGYKVAPEKKFEGTYNPQFHVWISSFLFKINGVDENSNIGEKTNAIYLIPVIFAVLSVIPIFFIIRKFSNDLFATFGSLILVTIGTYVSRTVAGFVDTDAYVVFFPLMISAFILYSFLYKNRGITVTLAIIAGFFQGMFIWSWGPGWFIFVFMLTSLIGYSGFIILVNLLESRKLKEYWNSLENLVLIIISFMFSSALFTYLLFSRNIFLESYEGLFSSISGIASISTSRIWPNVLSSVAELNPASFGTVISATGGKIIFLIAILGIILLSLDFKVKNEKFKYVKPAIVIFSVIWLFLIIQKNYFVFLTANFPLVFLGLLFLPVGFGLLLSLINHNHNKNIFFVILLSIWMAGTVYMSFNGVRFILLLGPAFAISFGIGLYYISKSINNLTIKEFKLEDKLVKNATGFIVVSLLFFFLFNPLYTNANTISNGTLPNFDDVWYDSMNQIRENSNENAIITSWWDFGHFFATVGQRGVTFDGGSQATPQSHWVGKLLLETETEKSLDMLRMLVCGGNNAFYTMLEIAKTKDSFTNENADAVKINRILYETFGKTYDEKLDIITNNKYYSFSESEIDEIINYLHCQNPPENFLITSGDMIGKAPVWAHWGSWSFEKKYIHDFYTTKNAEEISNEIDFNITIVEQYILELENIDNLASSQNIKRSDLINQWFAPYPSYINIQGSSQFNCIEETSVINCIDGQVIIDKITGNLSGPFIEQNPIKNLIFPADDETVRVVEFDSSGEADITILPSSTGPKIMFSQSPMGNSLFTKLYYLDGVGAPQFDKFFDKQSATGNRVLIWKVNWDYDPNEQEDIIDISNIEFSEELVE